MAEQKKKEPKYVELSATLDLSEDLEAIFKQAQANGMASNVDVKNEAIIDTHDDSVKTQKTSLIRKIINGLRRNS